MSITLKKELQHRLLKELECPVCMELMMPPIILCKNGHNQCCNCRVTMENCPICKGPFLKVRNLSLENLAPDALVPCRNFEKGCPDVFKVKDLKTHEAKCLYGNHRCPYALISNVDCNWSGPLVLMKDHVESKHNDKSVQHVTKKFKATLYNVNKAHRFYQVVITQDEVFYINWRIEKGGMFHCAVFYVGPHEKAPRFQYRFSITTHSGETETRCVRTHSYLDDVEGIFRKGKCIKLDPSIIQKCCIGKNQLPFRMEISKIS